MNSGMMVVIGLLVVLAIGGFVLPMFRGDTYHSAKWRIVVVVCILGLIWILLTPNGCNLSR